MGGLHKAGQDEFQLDFIFQITLHPRHPCEGRGEANRNRNKPNPGLRRDDESGGESAISLLPLLAREKVAERPDEGAM